MIVNRIPESAASQIMYKIADILALEFNSQIALGNTFLPTEVAADYCHAIDEGQMPFVGVMYSDTEYQADFPSQSDVISKYIIECKASDYPTARKIAEVVRAILKNSIYKTLDLPSDFGIKNTRVSSINMSIFEQRQSTKNSTTAYIVYEVSHYELMEKVEGVPLVLNSNKVTREDGTLYFVDNLN